MLGPVIISINIPYNHSCHLLNKDNKAIENPGWGITHLIH